MESVFYIAIVAIAFIGIGVTPVYAELLEKQADAAILVKIFGDEFTFHGPNYQMKAPQIHFADGNSNSFHRYHEDATMELLFNSMNIVLDHQCYVFPDERAFCTNEDYSLKYFINDKLVSDIRNYIIQDNDRILITFGGETDKQISELYLSELNSIKIKSGDAVATSNDFFYPDFKILEKSLNDICIDNMNTDWKISFAVDLVVNDMIMPKVNYGWPYGNPGITEECQIAIYTSADGTSYAEWIENPNFELRDFMDASFDPWTFPTDVTLEVYVNDRVVETGLNTPLQDKTHYKIVFITADYAASNVKNSPEEIIDFMEETIPEETIPEETIPEETVSIPFNQKSGSNNSFQDNGDFYLVFDETENYKVYEDWVKGWDPIENQGTFFENQITYLNENFKLPYDVPIIIAECGESNAWYYSETNPSYSEIVICYELIDEINQFQIWSYQEDYGLTYEELTDEDWEYIGYQVLDTVDFVLYHELGHAFIDLYNLPITGLEENVADQFAAFILLETGVEEDVSIYVINAANFWLTSSEILEIDESNYSDVHGFDKQRFYNLACYAYGSNSQFNEELVNMGWIPENRIEYCHEEYDQIVNTWMILLDDYFIDTTYDSQSFERPENNEGGGCLIATATYGSELAPQVQQLRELRDNQLLQTESGSAFMSTFNDVYYSFSPIIADYERENPYFKEAVKLAITPMISTLSLMENAETESEVLGIGISVIMLNLAMYLGVPAIVVIGIRRKL